MSLLHDARAKRPYFALGLGVFLLDQASKIAADTWLHGRGAVTIVPGLFNLIYSRNRGGLFGYLSNLDDPWRILLLTILPLFAVVMIAIFLVRTDDTDRLTLVGLGLILGGATGNLVDRAVRGEVVDFLDAYLSRETFPGAAAWLIERFGTTHWPTFNVADSAIVVGAGLLFLEILRPRRQPAGSRASGSGPS